MHLSAHHPTPETTPTSRESQRLQTKRCQENNERESSRDALYSDPEGEQRIRPIRLVTESHSPSSEPRRFPRWRCGTCYQIGSQEMKSVHEEERRMAEEEREELGTSPDAPSSRYVYARRGSYMRHQIKTMSSSGGGII